MSNRECGINHPWRQGNTCCYIQDRLRWGRWWVSCSASTSEFPEKNIWLVTKTSYMSNDRDLKSNLKLSKPGDCLAHSGVAADWTDSVRKTGSHQVVFVTAGEACTAGLLEFLFQETANNPSLSLPLMLKGEGKCEASQERSGRVRGWTWNPSNKYGSVSTVFKRQTRPWTSSGFRNTEAPCCLAVPTAAWSLLLTASFLARKTTSEWVIIY